MIIMQCHPRYRTLKYTLNTGENSENMHFNRDVHADPHPYIFIRTIRIEIPPHVNQSSMLSVAVRGALSDCNYCCARDALFRTE